MSGPGEGAVPGAGCGKAVERAVWKAIAPFDLLRDLVDVPVEHGHRSEPREQLQRLGRIVGAPAPVGIDRPQRDVREDDDRRATTAGRRDRP